QIEQYLRTGAYEQPSDADRYQMIRSYYRMLLLREGRNDPETTGKMKQFASYFTHGVRNGSHLRSEIYHARTPDAIYDCVERFFASLLGHGSGEEPLPQKAASSRPHDAAAPHFSEDAPAGVR
ncbi:MAG TPA: hypothetical protein VFA54_03585, partial [Bryobacterales bacterium]|nr:hypothetical protein [Bryobacterales bacterium]